MKPRSFLRLSRHLFTISMLLAGASAFAQQAPTNPSSDFKPSTFKIEFESDYSILMKNKKMDAAIGTYGFGKNLNGKSLDIKMSKDLFIDGISHVSRWDAQGFMAINPGVNLQLDHNGKTLDRHNLELTGLSVFRFKEWDEEDGLAAGTLDFKVLPMSYVNKEDKLVGVKENGAEIAPVDFSGHIGFKLNSLPMDLCGGVTPLAIVIGDIEHQLSPTDKNTGNAALHWVKANVCLGAQIGERIGKLKIESAVDVSNIAKQHAYPTFATGWNNSVGLDDIGAKKKSKIRAGVFYTNSKRLNGRGGAYANRIDQNRVSLRVMF